MPSEQQQPPAESPPEATPAAPEQQETPEARLLKAQAVELAALRRRLADLPEPDALAEAMEKARRYDDLAQQLPQWRQQVADALQAEREQGRQQLDAQQEEIARIRTGQDAQRTFIEAGGRAEAWPVFAELMLKNVRREDDGSLSYTASGAPVPLQQAMSSLQDDPVYGAFFGGRLGSGGGSRSTSNGRIRPVVDMASMSTEEKFRYAFGGNRRSSK